MTDAKRRSPQDATPPVDSGTVLNPIIGFAGEDLLEAGRRLLTRALTQPAAMMEQSARLWQDWVGIALGQSDLAPDAIA